MSDEGDKQTQKIEPVKVKPLSKRPYEAEDDPNADQKNRWRELERNREVMSKKEGGGEEVGLQSTGPGESMKIQRVQFQKEEKKGKERQFKNLIGQIEEWNKRLAEIDTRLAEIGDRLEEIKAERSGIEELEELITSGKLDPQNERHKELMKRKNITEDDIKSGAWVLILNKKKEALNIEEGELEHEQTQLVEEEEYIKGLKEKAHDIAADPSNSEFFQELEKTNEGIAVSDKAVVLTQDSEAMHEALKSQGASEVLTRKAAAVDVDVSEQDLDALFAEEGTSISAANSYQKTPIVGPPLKEEFAKASKGEITEATPIKDIEGPPSSLNPTA